MSILITGADGFIGTHLAGRLADRQPRLLVRRNADGVRRVTGDVTDNASLARACEGIHTVFHCAGHAHAFKSRGEAEARRQWAVNFEGTRNLIEAAGTAGVSRFVHLSSVKAMAEPGEACVDETWPGEPDSDYGRAKRAAETCVTERSEHFGMQSVNLRLAMVYGPGGRGNLERMIALVGRGVFPLLPETGNRRSLVYVGDLVDAILLAGEHAQARGTYIVADPRAYSGRQILDAVRVAAGRPARTWQVPRYAMEAAAAAGDILSRLTGRPMPLTRESLGKLLGSACYDSGRIQRELGWQPRTSLAEGLAACVASNDRNK
ncbi:NAD-dependent epimerase/dehydratase family protein [Uliginosibacterium sp. sgz301328]|uniref:NAD-dependent epimerase/dehydratase family protein n=1 Tax=Uliginosibacterium sp. sgz301328 TaxID=3243764 RepID=UPI00359E25CC